MFSTEARPVTQCTLNRTATHTRAPSTVNTPGLHGPAAPSPAVLASSLAPTRSTPLPSTVAMLAPMPKTACATPRPAPLTARSLAGLPTAPAPRPVLEVARPDPAQSLSPPSWEAKFAQACALLQLATLSHAPSTALCPSGLATASAASLAQVALK